MAKFPTDEFSIARYRAVYGAADALAKEVENFRAEVAIPAHTQLRYAGYHLLKAIRDDGSAPDKIQLQKAIAHCERASFEAADAGILSALDMIAIFREDYKHITITDVCPGYSDVLRQAREANNLVNQGRQHSDDVQVVKSEYVETFKILKNSVEILEDHREELNKKITSDRKSYFRWMTRIVIAIFVGLMSVSVAILGIFWSP